MILNPEQIIKRAGEIYEDYNHSYDFKDKLRSNQVRAAIIAICEELNEQEDIKNNSYRIDLPLRD